MIASVPEARASIGKYLAFYNAKGRIRAWAGRRRVRPVSDR
jgi:hypothetical protein